MKTGPARAGRRAGAKAGRRAGGDWSLRDRAPLPLAWTPLPRSFFEAGAERVAPRLLGHWLVCRTESGWVGGWIVETEAYLAGDPASHGFRGETRRNRALFGPPGRAYVYFIYGVHWCFNAVCREAGVAEAVLVRAVEPAFGLEAMASRRPVARLRDLTSGPARLCAALGIDGQLDASDLCAAESPVFLARNEDRAAWLRARGPVVRTTRVGIRQAAAEPLRWYLGGSDSVSRRSRRA